MAEFNKGKKEGSANFFLVMLILLFETGNATVGLFLYVVELRILW